MVLADQLTCYESISKGDESCSYAAKQLNNSLGHRIMLIIGVQKSSDGWVRQ